jgi:1-acyl-sn-glycerol-3-phosphate acyltransferase
VRLIKTIVLFIITGFSMVLFTPAALVLLLVHFAGLKKIAAQALYRIAQTWARILIALTGCPMTVRGRENIPKRGPLCFVSNHVGIFDIILALAYAGRPFGFIAKKELLYLPGINLWIYLLGGLFINRGNPRNALKTINEGVRRIKGGNAMLIFPEGTRSRGRGPAPFHPGSLRLATQAGAPIVPVAITGSYDVFEKTRRVHAVPLSVSFLPPVDPAGMPPADRKRLLADQLHDSIVRTLETHAPPVVS